jgi:hypothetical protein
MLSIVSILSVILGSLIFLLSIVFCILQLTGNYTIDLYYNLIGLTIISVIGIYFIFMYVMTYMTYKHMLKIERLNRDHILHETNAFPTQNYSIKIIE